MGAKYPGNAGAVETVDDIAIYGVQHLKGPCLGFFGDVRALVMRDGWAFYGPRRYVVARGDAYLILKHACIGVSINKLSIGAT